MAVHCDPRFPMLVSCFSLFEGVLCNYRHPDPRRVAAADDTRSGESGESENFTGFDGI